MAAKLVTLQSALCTAQNGWAKLAETVSTMATIDREAWEMRDGLKKPAIWVAVALSLLVHAAALWQWLPHLRLSSSELTERRDTSGVLSVQLAPASPSVPPAAPAMQAQRPARLVAPKTASRTPPAPPVIALNERAASVPRSAAPPSAPPAPARPPVEGDLSSYIEARRRARGEPAPAPADSAPGATAAEDDNARANRIAAANLGVGLKPSFGPDPTHGGGIFQIQRLSYDYAEFIFYGWNKDIRRNTAQVIEVRKGNNSDIRVAVVRRMIAIIRDYEQEEFIWESKRLGRNLTLSARLRDNAGLEDFMMREFFSN